MIHKYKSIIFVFLLALLFFAIVQCQHIQNENLNKNIHVSIHTQGSSCEFNATHPIELKIENKSAQEITEGEIKYNVYEDLNSKMYGDNLSLVYSNPMNIKPMSDLKICVESPTDKNFITLTQKDINKDGSKIKKTYKNADVGFNIYNSEYRYKIEKKYFTVK